MNLNTVSIRVAIFVLFLTAVFLFTSYSASIVALLQSPSDSIKTIKDLVESSMTFSAQITPYGEIYFNVRKINFLQFYYNYYDYGYFYKFYTKYSKKWIYILF